MKKILFATTALVASTSFAMADVDLSGSAEMGIQGGDGIEDQFHTDIDVTFSMSGETDGGLTFGASIDLDESDGDPSDAFGETRGGGETIFVSGALGTLTMGETDGALDWAMNEAIIGSAISDDHEHAGYNGNSLLDNLTDGDDQVARYDYSFGGFAFAVSAEVQNTDVGDDTFGVGVTYDGEFGAISYGVGLGYQKNDNGSGDDIEGLGFSADIAMDSGLSAVFNYTDYDGLAQDDHIGVAIGYEFGQLLVAANYGKFDLVGGGDNEGYGLVANYDLGGGASLQAGYGNSDTPAGDSDTYSFGIAMSF